MSLAEQVQVAAAADEAALEAVRVSALGKKGTISEQMKGLGALSPDERKSFGAALNLIKDKVSDAISLRKAALADKALNERLARETVDVTLPVRGELRGTVHPGLPGVGRDRADFRRPRLCRGGRSAHRGRLPQFRRPQHAARTPGPAGA
jgi:hypothetical protein